VISDRAVERLRAAAAWPELDTRYEITGIAGHGGMGTVYIARDAVLDRDVAVKVLDITDGRGERVERLRREARILARLDHPGIVPIHDAGTLPDGRAFYVMKLVRGNRFDTLIDRPLADRLDAYARILDAVAFAHAHGIVHRDLKPDNVMTGAFGEVYVMDWGVAHDTAAAAESTVVGTRGYMPPEQEEGRVDVDARADIFALGSMLAQTTGPEAPAALRAIAARAMQARPEDRYQSVEALAADLTRFRAGERVEAHEETAVEKVVRVYRRYELPILLLLAYIVMRFALLVWRGI